MAKDRFLIAPINTGLQTNMKPFLIPDDAFASLQNAYIYRGRVIKRFGSRVLNETVGANVQQLYTRVGINIGTTNGAGNAAGTVPGLIFKVGQQFAVGDQIFTVVAQGNPAAMAATGGATGTFNTTNGNYTINGADALTDIYFYPAEPIMGIKTYEQSITNNINNEIYIIFDTQFAYKYDGTRFQRLNAETVLGDSQWSGTDSDFFWTTTYRGVTADAYVLFVSNYIPTNAMRTFDGTTWSTYAPTINLAGDTIVAARCITGFNGRLVLLNVIEEVGTVKKIFVNRIRYSIAGNPFLNDAFRAGTDNPTTNFLDAETREAIMSIGFIKDRLIVFFERSTWELVKTGNENFPFRFQRLNSELGVESTFSTVLFDQNVLGIGETGIYACNGSNVTRVDQKIPHEVFDIRNDNNGIARVQGIRDFYLELVYWIIPKVISDQSLKFPNQVLVYNYRAGTWALNDDSFTALGNFQSQNILTWNSSTSSWQDATFTWGRASIEARFLGIMAGNQQGFLAIIDNDETDNAQLLSITKMTGVPGTLTLTIINHNLIDDDWIQLANLQGTGTITNLNGQILQVIFVDVNTIQVVFPNIVGNYVGGGTVARVTPIDILTKQYNFYLKQGVNFNINAIDFHVSKTQAGVFNVDYFTNTSETSLSDDAQASGAALGNGSVETSPYTTVPYEQTQERLWHRFYPDADGEFIQLRLYLNDANIQNPVTALSDFELHGILFHTNVTASRLQ